MASIFTMIIEGKIPSYKVFEDEHTVAFLSKEQIQLGHTLVVPKIEVDFFSEVPEPYYSAIFKTAKPLARAIHRVTRCKRVGAFFVGWDVPHCHFHLTPMFDPRDMDFRNAKDRTPEDCKKIQAQIIEELKRGS